MEIGKERLNCFLDEQCLQEWVGLNAKQYYYPNNKTTKNVNENMTTTRVGGAKSLKCL